MAEQSRLENIGITKRTQLISKNDYNKLPDKEYNESHPDAKSDGDPLGKGNGTPMTYAEAKPEEFSIDEYGVRKQRMNYETLSTKENGDKTIGGSFDRLGRTGLDSGRLKLMSMNKYKPDSNEYGIDSVDTTVNRADGQYIS